MILLHTYQPLYACISGKYFQYKGIGYISGFAGMPEIRRIYGSTILTDISSYELIRKTS